MFQIVFTFSLFAQTRYFDKIYVNTSLFLYKQLWLQKENTKMKSIKTHTMCYGFLYLFQDMVLLQHCAFSSHDLPLGYWMQCALRVCWLFLLQLCSPCAGGFWYSGSCESLWCSDGCRYCPAGTEFLLLGLPLLLLNQVLGTLLSVLLSVKKKKEGQMLHMLKVA